jgi:hypothetical protein
MRRGTGRCDVVAFVVALGVVLGASCGGDAARFEVPRVFDIHPVAGGDAASPANRAVPVSPTAAQLRHALEQALAWHGISLVEVMRSARRHDPQTPAWIEQLVANTDELTADVALVYGHAASLAFYQQWAQHTQFLVDYAAAVGTGDRAAADEARRELHTYATDSGAFFAQATGDRLPSDAVRALLETHVGHMLALIDADAAGDQLTVSARAHEDNQYLAGIAGGLATAFAAQQPLRFIGPVDGPTTMLCTLTTTNAGDYLLAALLPGPPEAATDAADRLAAVLHLEAAHAIGDAAALRAADERSVATAARGVLDRAGAAAAALTP